MDGMSGNDSELDSECGRRSDDGVEWISRLPDDIIVYILSFLPLKDAVATSLVSQRWSHLWRYTPNLIFKNNPYLDPMINIPVTIPKHKEHDHKYLLRSRKNVEWVNSVLDSHKALSLKQFTISFYLYDFQDLIKWLHYALSRRVERLKLNLYYANPILDCNFLSSLPSCNFKFIRELKLKKMNVSGMAVEVIVNNCSSLERLIMRDAMLTSDLMVSSTTLKYLYISEQRYGILTKVSAPNLTRLNSSYYLGFLFLENVPNLVEASFYQFEGDSTDHIANAAANLEILTFTLYCRKVSVPNYMPRLHKLVLDCSRVDEKFQLPITSLLDASPCLGEFRLKIRHIYMYTFGFPTRKSIFEVPKLRNQPAQHEHLNVFEFSGFCCVADDHMELLMYVVDRCVALRDIVISPIPAIVVPEFRHQDPRNFPESNPHLVWPSSYDCDVVATEERDATLMIKKWTEQLVAGKIPPHIKLHINTNLVPDIYGTFITTS